MDLKNKLEQLFEPALNEFGLTLVLVQIGGTTRVKLHVIIERLDGQSVSMDDCVRASREMSTLLDVADPIDSAYVLEVSSPGEDRPLVKAADYQRFIASEIKLEIYVPIDGRKRFKGLLKSATEQGFVLACDADTEVKLNYDQVVKARLCPPDPQPPLKKRRS